MSEELIVTILTSASSLLVAIVTVVANNRVLGYKVDQLTKKVEEHNKLVERVAVLERDNKTAFNLLDNMREDIKSVRGK